MSCSILLIGCPVVGIKVMIVCSRGPDCAWPLLLFEQSTFAIAFIHHMCTGEVRPVLMMKLAYLIFL